MSAGDGDGDNGRKPASSPQVGQVWTWMEEVPGQPCYVLHVALDCGPAPLIGQGRCYGLVRFEHAEMKAATWLGPSPPTPHAALVPRDLPCATRGCTRPRGHAPPCKGIVARPKLLLTPGSA